MLVFASCKDDKESEETDDTFSTEQTDDSFESEKESEENSNNSSENNRNTNDSDEMEETPDDSRENNQKSISNAKFIKDGESDADCSCFCIEMNTSGSTELCLQDEEIYINTRLSQNGNITQVYYTGPSSKNTNEDLPWDEFDTNTPVAEITSTANGMELDWKGLSINGELSVDHAIYGKKTLEGTYKKQ